MRSTLAGIVLAALAVSTTASAAGFVLEEKARLRLAEPFKQACDLRFDDPRTLVLSARRLGIARVSYDGQSIGSPEVLLPEGGGGIVLAEHLGLSATHLVVSSPMSQLRWFERRPGGGSGGLGTWESPDRAPISFFEDIDLRGDRLAILGLMRSDTGMSPDGSIAWLGRLGAGSSVELQPIAFSTAGRGARPFDACSVFAIGKIRFLADGRLLLVPGAEPGVFLYSAEGKLLRSWDTGALGLDIRCDLDQDTALRFHSDVPARLEYINRFTTVDEVLPTSIGPALLLRRVDGEGTHWRMVVFHENGGTQTAEIPFGSPSARAHLRGDVLGDRVLLVLREFLPQPGLEKPELIELRLRPQGDEPKTPSMRN